MDFGAGRRLDAVLKVLLVTGFVKAVLLAVLVAGALAGWRACG